MKDAIPEMTWGAAVAALLNFRFESLYDQWNEKLSDAELYFVPSVEVDEELIQHELEDIDQLSDLC